MERNLLSTEILFELIDKSTLNDKYTFHVTV